MALTATHCDPALCIAAHLENRGEGGQGGGEGGGDMEGVNEIALFVGSLVA